MKGIILAGGSGTRLHPVTRACSKQILPIYDKPMVYYPLSVLMLAGIREILIISTPRDIGFFKDLFGNGGNWGLEIQYAVQEKPDGIARALIIAEKFTGDSPVALVLGDNVFWGQGFSPLLKKTVEASSSGATVFGYQVQDPHRFGVVAFDEKRRVTSLEEKPVNPQSHWAVTGLYFYDSQAATLARALKPSPRGELEITDLNKKYLEMGKLNVELLGRGFAWLDTGTHDSMLEASQFVQTIEKRQGLKIACIEEIAFKNKWINETQLKILADELGKIEYGQYLQNLLKDHHAQA